MLKQQKKKREKNNGHTLIRRPLKTTSSIFFFLWLSVRSLSGMLEWFLKNFASSILPTNTTTHPYTHTHTHIEKRVREKERGRRIDGKSGAWNKKKKWIRVSHSVIKPKWLFFSWKAGNGQGLLKRREQAECRFSSFVLWAVRWRTSGLKTRLAALKTSYAQVAELPLMNHDVGPRRAAG